MLRDPGQGAARGTHHRVEGRAISANAVAAREERGVDSRSARIRRVEHRAGAAPGRHRYVRLKQLRDVQLAPAQRLQIVRHRPAGHAIGLVRIDVGKPQIMLEAEPWRRHLRDGPEPEPQQIGEPECRRISLAHQKERIARRHLAKADHRRIRVLVLSLHDAHRPTPGDIDRPVEQTRSGGGRRRRIEQFHVHPFGGVVSERMRGIEWRVEHRAKIFRELDVHGHSELNSGEKLPRDGYRQGIKERQMRSLPRFLLIVAALVIASAHASHAQATYPNRAIQLVVTVPPGGAADNIARVIGAKLADALGQPVIINNRAGAGGTTAAAQVAKSDPDGYTVLLNTVTTHGIGPHLYPNLAYDPVKDFEPVILVAKLPLIMALNADVPARSVQEVIALA